MTRANQVTIPAEIVKKLGLKRGEKLIITLEEGKIVLVPKKIGSIRTVKLGKKMDWKFVERVIEEELAK